MVTSLGNMTPTHDSFSRNALKNKQPCVIEPAGKDFTDTKYENITVLAFTRSRLKLPNFSVDETFEKEIVISSNEELTRKIVLEQFDLAKPKTCAFLKELNKPFNQLSKNEIIEISFQVPLVKRERIWICYKRFAIHIVPIVGGRKVYATENNVQLKENARVYKIVSIT